MGGGLWFWAKEVLVGSGGLGVSRISRKIFPLKPFYPFSPLFLPSTLSFNSLTPQNSPRNSLDQACSPFLLLFPFFPPLQPLPFSFSSSLGPYRTSSEHLRNPSIGSPKGPKRPFLGLFRGFPPKPLKGLKTPFLGPFWPLFHPYPTLSKIPIYWRVTTLPSFIGKPKHGTF